MSTGQIADGATTRRGIFRRAPAGAVCLVAAVLLPSGLEGLSAPVRPDAGTGPQARGDATRAGSCAEDARTVVRAAVAFLDAGDPDRADTVLSNALDRCPDQPELLEGLAGLRFRQGHLAEAEALATRLVRLHPESVYGWQLLASVRYLRDDAHGALRAWSRGRALVVREVEIHVHRHGGQGASGGGPDPIRVAGIVPGQPLTLEALVRGTRRLEGLPATARARVGYRALPGGEAAVDGTVLLRARNPFTLPSLAAHSVRLLAGGVQLVSADPLGRLERWELAGSVEGQLRRVGISLDHPAPGVSGVWRWQVYHEVGRYGSPGHGEVLREERTGVGWSHSDWVTGSSRGTIHGRVDVRRERGTFAGAGVGWTLLDLGARGSIGSEATGWVRVGRETAGAGEPDSNRRFGRLEVRASLHPSASQDTGAPRGVDVRGGIVTVTARIPPDLIPRIGSGGNVDLLMRARSDLDGAGVVRPLFPGTAWAHGGVEVLRPLGSVGPVGIGMALFADGVHLLATDRRSADGAARRGAVHLGAGMRARLPGIDGGLRVDWGFDPADNASTFSASWFRGHRLTGLPVP